MYGASHCPALRLYKFWGGIVDDAAFVVAALLRIVLVQCHGGIENERTRSLA